MPLDDIQHTEEKSFTECVPPESTIVMTPKHYSWGSKLNFLMRWFDDRGFLWVDPELTYCISSKNIGKINFRLKAGAAYYRSLVLHERWCMGEYGLHRGYVNCYGRYEAQNDIDD